MGKYVKNSYSIYFITILFYQLFTSKCVAFILKIGTAVMFELINRPQTEQLGVYYRI